MWWGMRSWQLNCLLLLGPCTVSQYSISSLPFADRIFTLSPNAAIASAPGPKNLMPLAFNASGSSGFSEAWPLQSVSSTAAHQLNKPQVAHRCTPDSCCAAEELSYQQMLQHGNNRTATASLPPPACWQRCQAPPHPPARPYSIHTRALCNLGLDDKLHIGIVVVVCPSRHLYELVCLSHMLGIDADVHLGLP